MSWGFAVGLPIKPKCGWKLSPAQRDEAARRYAAGESLTKLAKEFGVSKPSIIHLAKARNLARPTKREAKHESQTKPHTRGGNQSRLLSRRHEAKPT